MRGTGCFPVKAVKLFFLIFSAVIAAVGQIAIPAAQASTVDLTSYDSGSINGVLFNKIDEPRAGSGTLHSFLRLNSNDPEERGYNTDHRYARGAADLEYDQNPSPNFTRSLLLSQVPTVMVDGIRYREFILDINEPLARGNDHQAHNLSLDQLQIFLGNSPDLHDFGSADLWQPNTALVYDMNPGGAQNWVEMSCWPAQGGSGWADVAVFIPDALFADLDPSFRYLYLYSLFGAEFHDSGSGLANDGGFEEWAVAGQANAVPEPSALLLIGAGFFGILPGVRTRHS